jgi:hypothetical protein
MTGAPASALFACWGGMTRDVGDPYPLPHAPTRIPKGFTQFNPGDGLPIPRSPDVPIFLDQCHQWQSAVRFSFSDQGDHARCRRSRRSPDPPRPFFHFCCKQNTYPNPRLGGACMALGPRLGGPWVAQAPPKPNPNRQRVATFCQIPITKCQIPASPANCLLSKILCRSHAWALPEYSGIL